MISQILKSNVKFENVNYGIPNSHKKWQ